MIQLVIDLAKRKPKEPFVGIREWLTRYAAPR
jgi:hypothetical protein